MTKTIVVGLGDTHINSTVGLCKPIINLDDGGSYRSSRNQKIMWNYFLDFCTLIKDKKADRKIAILNGDILELDTKIRSRQVITRNKATVLRMVVGTLEPLLDVVDNIIVIRGTTAHVGKSAQYEEKLAEDLSDIIIPSKTSFSHEHLRIEFEGIRFDIAHHASMGRLPWTEKNAANKVAAITAFNYIGQKPPHYILRSHMHKWSDSGLNYNPMIAIFLPCWQLKTEFVYRIGKENDVPDIGGLFVTCEKGESVWERVLYPIDNRKTFMKF